MGSLMLFYISELSGYSVCFKHMHTVIIENNTRIFILKKSMNKNEALFYNNMNFNFTYKILNY